LSASPLRHRRVLAAGTRLGSTTTWSRTRSFDDLEQARKRLGEIGTEASYRLLIEGKEPSLTQFAADGGFDLVLLPARRRLLRAARHPAAPRLRLAGAGAEVRVVGERRGDAAG
jgi:hypothetical protein